MLETYRLGTVNLAPTVMKLSFSACIQYFGTNLYTILANQGYNKVYKPCFSFIQCEFSFFSKFFKHYSIIYV